MRSPFRNRVLPSLCDVPPQEAIQNVPAVAWLWCICSADTHATPVTRSRHCRVASSSIFHVPWLLPIFSMRALFCFIVLILPLIYARSLIDRRKIVKNLNVHRNASSDATPLQVGNGNFAFGADVTGLQTFKPFATMSTWGWHNFSLPTTPKQTSVDGSSASPHCPKDPPPTNRSLDFTGLDWCTHGRLVNYDQPNPAEADISTWLIANPQRLNLGSIGLYFGGAQVSESDLTDKSQVLDVWTGSILSTFSYNGTQIRVQTRAATESDTVGISVESELLSTGALGLSFDFPYADATKFDAPFVGVWNATSNHSTSLKTSGSRLVIQHSLDTSSYFLTAAWEGTGQVTGPESGTHRYFLTVPGSSSLNLTAAFSPDEVSSLVSLNDLADKAEVWWEDYWTSGAFIDLTSTSSTNATELQRRIILSQYLLVVNSASRFSPQESGLVNNGWYGKFHVGFFSIYPPSISLW